MSIDLHLKPNTLYHGDCLDIMRVWAKTHPDGCADLIYLDPPFNSNANYNVLYGKDQKGKPLDERAQFIAFNDTWYWSIEAAERVNNIKNAVGHPAHKAIWGLSEMLPESGMLAYLSYMAERLAVMRGILKDTGSIYLHCDPTASHYLKTIMDCVFGVGNFRNEIVWCYTGPSGAKYNFPAKHDVVLRYTKSQVWTFNADSVRIPYKELHSDKGKGAKFWGDKGKLQNEETRKRYEARGKVPEDYWLDIPSGGHIPPDERLGYPTQKPLALLERIIEVSSNKGDLVLDPFCGCGTTAEAAWKLKRRFVGIDISSYAITRVCKDRMKRAGGVSVMGLPTDMRSARALCAADPFAFEHWAISLLEGYAPNDKQVADGGIDGRGRLLNPPLDESGKPEKGLCVAQVKGGKPGADALRAFLSQIAGGAFSMGVFVTLEKPRETPTMREVATKAGAFQSPGGAKTYNRIVFWSIEEYFDGIEAKLPDMTHPFTGKALHPEIPAD
ncbi:MAG: DNA methyltransferase [Gammaproteobacteria bacterium]|nr:DNA methyltransferase [Gammaproteobacteria bacterium]MDD9855638.1 DNA methyltransferase [Gammaproteobacteria bacterium]